MIPDRPSRVADNIFRFIGDILLTDVNDPRLERVTVTGVDISPDLKNAIVFFSLMDNVGVEIVDELPESKDELAEYINHVDSPAVKEAQRAFRKAEGFIKKRLTTRLNLKRLPKLNFQFDPSYSRGHKIGKIIDKVIKNDGTHDE